MHGLPPPSTTGSQPEPPSPTPGVLRCRVLHLGLPLLDVLSGFVLFHPTPPAASFFFLFSSFFFSFFLLFCSFFFSSFLLFLSCSDELEDSSLEESLAGGEAG